MMSGFVVGGCRRSPEVPRPDAVEKATPNHTAERRKVAIVTRLEEATLALTPKLAWLAADVRNLKLPGFRGRKLLADEVHVVDVAERGEPETVAEVPRTGLKVRRWSRSGPSDRAGKDLQLLRPVLSSVDYFDEAKFYFIASDFAENASDRLNSNVGFEALGHVAEGDLRWFKGRFKVAWRNRAKPGDEADWRIVAWELVKLTSYVSRRAMFREVLDRAIPDKSTLTRARESIQQQIIRRVVADETYQPPHRFWSWESQDRHPGVAVVDLDRDGFDDVYVMDEFGRNLFLRNRGDGTFEDIAEQLGLDFENNCSCAVFADFDNDGDADLFLGRTMQPSLYLTNKDGRFVDRSEWLLSEPLPALVSSISAADYNQDGLLDVYFSTYAGKMIDQLVAEGVEAQRLLEGFLPRPPAPEFLRLVAHYDATRARPGPPNVLLVNRGHGRFEPAPKTANLEVWRNTFQSIWADYDDDGDVDLYVVNDFSPSKLFRNEGNGTFVDATRETGTADIGFGMGATWGDYDNDGRQDLYKSNMFSKAGRRIAGRMGSLISPEFLKMAAGNTLFHNVAGRMEKVSGLEPPAMLVEKAGWSWGGQFVDVDNSGYLDIYVVSGYYTPPPEVAVAFDL